MRTVGFAMGCVLVGSDLLVRCIMMQGSVTTGVSSPENRESKSSSSSLGFASSTTMAALTTVLTGGSTDASNAVVEIPAYEAVDRDCEHAHSPDYNFTTTAVNFPCELYRVKSAPAVVPGGSVGIDTTSDNRPWFVYGSRECTGAFCSTLEKQRFINGDAIVLYVSHHYFHFMYETALRLYPLFLHDNLAERYRNATVLCYPDVPNENNFDFLKAIFGSDFFSRDNYVKAEKNLLYKVHSESTLIVPRFNDYHSGPKFRPYNIWLLQSLRHQLIRVVEDPQAELFISRRGYRRGVEREDDLFASLRKSVLPDLQQVLPDDYSVAEQAKMFANAKLIIAPHGASLTNVLFANWKKLVLIEITPRHSSGGFASFRNDLRVEQHYMLQCESVPCSVPMNDTNAEKLCDPWNRQIDVHVENATRVVESILTEKHGKQEDFYIAATRSS